MLEWCKERYVCILSVVRSDLSPEDREVGRSSLTAQDDVSKVAWPLCAE